MSSRTRPAMALAIEGFTIGVVAVSGEASEYQGHAWTMAMDLFGSAKTSKRADMARPTPAVAVPAARAVVRQPAGLL